MTSTQRNWYLLTSKPHKDAEAEMQLRNQNYEVYRPLAKRLRRQRGKMVSITESLFPRYLFIHLDNGVEDNWSPIRSTRGLHGFARFGSQNLPTSIPERLILDLQAKEEGLSERAIDLDRFHQGDKVIITDGPFHGYEAVFQKYDGEERSFVLLEILKKMTQLPISPAALQAA